MRPSLIVLSLLSISASSQASWFSSSNDPAPPPYSTWSPTELRAWLQAHNVPIPDYDSAPDKGQLLGLVKENWGAASAWTYDQYSSAQKSFADIRDSTFDSWDESRLREFLLQQGVVAPKGPREQLVLLAKSKYRAYTDAASSFQAQASTAVYGDTAYQMSKSVSSVGAQATDQAARVFDDSKDYVYSTWDDNQLRSYLEKKGVLDTKAQAQRSHLLNLMKDAYAKVTNPVWEAWSDTYIHEWLVSHNVIKSDTQKNRDMLKAKMALYYYNVSDSVWSTWSDSDLKAWLVEHDIIKRNAEPSRDKMIKLVSDNYSAAKDTFWSAWSDNQIRTWLVEHNYLRSDAEVKRDEMLKLANEKYTDMTSRSADYLVWPDARLRAYLRQQGVSEDKVPTARPGLLQETRIRYVQSTSRAEAAVAKIRDIVNARVLAAEEGLWKVWGVLTGADGWVTGDIASKARAGYDGAAETADKARNMADEKAGEAGDYYDEKVRQGQDAGSKATQHAGQQAQEGREFAGEKIKQAGQKVKGEL